MPCCTVTQHLHFECLMPSMCSKDSVTDYLCILVKVMGCSSLLGTPHISPDELSSLLGRTDERSHPTPRPTPLCVKFEVFKTFCF